MAVEKQTPQDSLKPACRFQVLFATLARQLREASVTHCGKCGAVLNDGTAFCSSCGAPQATGGQSAAAPGTPAEAPVAPGGGPMASSDSQMQENVAGLL